MRHFVLSLAVLAFAAAPVLAQEKYNDKITIGQKAPNFSGIPACMGSDECSLSLSDIKEDVVVLVFLANHCPVVQMYEDRINEFVTKNKGKSVKVVAVAVTQADEDRLPAIKERSKEKGFNYVYGHDESQKIGRAYGAKVTPEFFVLDKTRNIRYAGAMDDSNNEGKVTKHYLADAVNAVLAGETVEVAKTSARGCGVRYASKSK